MREGKAWDRRYNVSGAIVFGGHHKNGVATHATSVDDWCGVLRCVLQTDLVGMIGHFTGAVSVYASAPAASVVSSGFDEHDFWAMVSGERAQWIAFATSLQSALRVAEIRHSVSVQDTVQVLP